MDNEDLFLGKKKRLLKIFFTEKKLIEAFQPKLDSQVKTNEG